MATKRIITNFLLILTICILIISGITLIFRIFDPFHLSGLIYPGEGMCKTEPLHSGTMMEVKRGSRTAYGYYIPGRKGLVVFFHGNAQSMDAALPLALRFNKEGFCTLLVEYPGYGLACTYSTSEKSLYQDTELLIRTAQKTYNIEPKETVLFGYSLGSGVAVEMKRRGLGNATILVAAYTAITDVASQNVVPVLPYLLLRDRYQSLHKLESTMTPILCIHGAKDKGIPPDMSKKLAKKIPGSDVIIIKEAGHDVILYVTRPDLFNKILAYINSVLVQSG